MGCVYLNHKGIITQNKSGEELGKNILRNVFKITRNNRRLLERLEFRRSNIKNTSNPDRAVYKDLTTRFDILKKDNSFSVATISHIFGIINNWMDAVDQEIIKDCKAERNKEYFFMAIKSILVLVAVSGLGFYIRTINIKTYE
jgi:hypothetical protein